MSSDTPLEEVHHEKQRRLLCALHSINNLLQSEYGDHATKSELDGICEEFALTHSSTGFLGGVWPNPHRHWTGLGDYDANVLMAALSRRGLMTEYHDARLPIRANEQVVSSLSAMAAGVDSGLVGFIVNRRAGGFFSLFHGRHWYAVRCIRDKWMNLDSLKDKPAELGSIDDAMAHLQQALDNGASILVVTRTYPTTVS